MELARYRAAAGQKILLGAEDICGKADARGLVAQGELVSVEGGFQIRSQAEGAANVTGTQVTLVVFSLNVDGSASGRQNIGSARFNLYDLAEERTCPGQQPNDQRQGRCSQT